MSLIYPDRESKTLEFKSALPNFQTLIRTCVAFANGIGGKIVIGVDDTSKAILGIDNKTRDRVYDEFPNSLYDATSPNLFAEIYEKRFDDLSVMIIEIPYGLKKPVFVKSEGMPKGVYLRAGSSTRKASQEYIDELLRESTPNHFDEEKIDADISILSKEQIKTALKTVSTERLLHEKIIRIKSNREKKYCPTVSGILCFYNQPDQFIPEALIYCTRFHGTSGRNIIQTEAIHGNIEKQIETAFQLVKSWLIRDYQLQNTKLKGRTLVPEDALREAITNALIHRKYWIPGATKIALYDDRLEIFNPGSFPGLFDLNQLGDGTTYLRNPTLARLARRLGVVEKLGTGIHLIFESCRNAGIKKPLYIEGADSVKLIFSFLPNEKPTSSDEERLLDLFQIKPEVKLSDVENYLNVSRNTATRKLSRLMDNGKIQRLGRGPAVRYVLIS